MRAGLKQAASPLIRTSSLSACASCDCERLVWRKLDPLPTPQFCHCISIWLLPTFCFCLLLPPSVAQPSHAPSQAHVARDSLVGQEKAALIVPIPHLGRPRSHAPPPLHSTTAASPSDNIVAHLKRAQASSRLLPPSSRPVHRDAAPKQEPAITCLAAPASSQPAPLSSRPASCTHVTAA